MISRLGIDYLRLSLTGHCDLRCIYCRPEEGPAPGSETPLTSGEILNLVRHLSHRHGVAKVRLTGGEPTLHRDLLSIVGEIASLPGVRDLALTTNGLRLASLAGPLARAGLDRVNVSLDTLDASRFKHFTGAPGLDRVLSGIAAVPAAGLTPLKLNTVVLRGENEEELPDLARYAREAGAVIRFIEFMPMGPLADSWEERFVPEKEIRERLGELAEAAHVGFISPMSHPFCETCRRLRVTSDGTLFPCLMDRPRGSLLPALRPRLDPERLDGILAGALAAKAKLHPERGPCVMASIGG